MAQLRAISFDLDGTLVDTSRFIFEGFQHLARKYLQRSIDISTIQGITKPAAYQKIGLPADKLDECLEEHLAFELANTKLVTSFDMIHAVIQQLREKQYHLSIITNRERLTTTAVL